jgi:hypothetical protein
VIVRTLRGYRKSILLLILLAIVLGGLLLLSDPGLAPKFKYSFF